MPDQFSPNVPAIPLAQEGSVLAMQQGAPLFVGGITTLAQAAVSIGIPSSGTIGNNGALSALTAFPTTYLDCYLFFPANAIATGVAAGFYYCRMTSTTAGTIFNNLLVTGAVPVPIVNPTPFVTTGPGAYTQSVATQTLLGVTVRGGAMRETGAISIYNLLSMSNSGNNKTTNLSFGGTAVQLSITTTNTSYENILWIYNKGRVNRQVVSPVSPTTFGGANSPNVFMTVNTASNFNITLTGGLSDAADFIVLEALTAQLISPTI